MVGPSVSISWLVGVYSIDLSIGWWWWAGAVMRWAGAVMRWAGAEWGRVGANSSDNRFVSSDSISSLLVSWFLVSKSVC